MPGVAPNAYLIGAQKAGTTLLAMRLDQSEDVCVSSPKEPHYFTSQYHRGPEWYATCFARPDAPVLLDASTTYSYLRPRRAMGSANAPGLTAPVPERIADLNPDARLIYILRDPVARAVSAFKHRLRYDVAPPGPVYLPDVLDADPMIELASRYADQIDRYLEVFDRDRFLFIDFAELTADPAGVTARAAAHLGIAAPPLPPELSEKGARHGAHRATTLGRLRRTLATRVPGLERNLRWAIPETVQQRLIARMLKRDFVLRVTGQAEAAKRFSADRERVWELTGLAI